MLSLLFNRIPRAARVTAAALWALAVLALSLLPSRYFAGTAEIACIPGADKIVHGLIYSVLTALLLWATTLPDQPRRFRRYSFAAAAAVAFGLLMEWLQHFTGFRSMDLLDALANTVGAFVVAGAGWWMAGKRKG